MHEYALLTNLLQKIDSLAKQHSASKVTRVKLKMGTLSHVSEDHLREHFLRESKGTVAYGAHLEVEIIPDPFDARAQDILLDEIEVA